MSSGLRRVWWLAPGEPLYIIALDGANVTAAVVHATWNRRTGPYVPPLPATRP